MPKFNFNFSEVSDLSPELRSKFATSVPAQSSNIAAILADPDCPGALNITQLMVVYSRAFGPVPTAATFRAWLNKGVAAGLIVKPSKQTYTAGAKALAGAVETSEQEIEDILGDPLA